MAHEGRKTVTVVFVDLADSTGLGSALDPEALREVLRQYFDTVSAVMRRHGGTVEKFIGDAVMAVFGVPTVHEDDALRAVRAAVEARDAVAAMPAAPARERGLSIAVAVGVNTGEVFAADPSSGQAFVTGDPVNVAARLEQAAGADEILIGDPTRTLVRDAVRLAAVGPLELRGKDEPLPAWRVLEVMDGRPAFARRLDAPLVGRRPELAELEQAFEHIVRERTNALVTVLGPPGIGKSRLAGELTARVGGRATVVGGRCLPYGEGITFWPLVQVVRELAEQLAAPSLAALLEGEEDAEAIAARVAGAIGRAEPAGTAEETFWAVRKLLEAAARRRPLVVVLEDLHWAEPTFLDLVDHVAEWSRGAPILLLCLARAELLDLRPGWGRGKRDGASLTLEPLGEDEAARLVDSLAGAERLSPELRAKVAATAEGNPLFVEQILAMVADAPPREGELEVPPTIQALLAARIDALPSEERTALERAATIGGRFWLRAVLDLLPEDERAAAPDVFQRLVRKELVRPDAPVVPGEEGFRFGHQLIRDAVYAGMAKAVRADLHERFATLIAERVGERVAEVEEILGYHVEQASLYLRELGGSAERERALASRGAAHLAAAGKRALARGDVSAASKLLRRAGRLLPPGDAARAEVLAELGGALVLAGELADADAVLAEAVAAGATAGDRRIELHAGLERAFVNALRIPETGVAELERASWDAIPELEELGDDRGLAKAWRRVADVNWMRYRWDEQERALERALGHAERAGDAREAGGALMRLAMALYYGSSPVDEGIARAETTLARAEGNRLVESTFLVSLAGLHAFAGRFDEARELLARGSALAEEFGLRVWLAGYSLVAADIELLAGDPVAAEEALRVGYARLEEIGEGGILATVAARLARALAAQGRDGEAEAFTEVSERTAAQGDLAAQIEWRSVRARLLARRGEGHAAEELAREAVELSEWTDASSVQAAALTDLAAVLGAAGRDDEAAPLLARALELHERRGNVAAARAAARA